ncbi:MAG: TIGR01777 family protein [Ferruginibacter sp.]|nr:TIGR01777 family protein [Rhodoferax sp.]
MPTHHILITGGTGFLGQALCRMLLAQGHSITLWVRNLDKAGKIYGDSVRCITQLAELQDTQVDAILNFSGEPVLGPRWSPARQQVLHASRSGVTLALVEWVAQLARKPRWLLSASAIGYYGVQSPGDPKALGEGAPPQPIFMSDLCQRWEQAAHKMAAYGVAVATVRLGVVLGQQGGALPQMLQPFRMGVGTQMGAGGQVLSWVHLDDVLGAVAFLLAKLDTAPATGAYNLTAPQPVTQREFTRIAGKVLHRPLAIPVPSTVLKLLLGEQATLLTDGQRVVPQRLLAEGYRFRFDTFEAALRDLEQQRK